MRKLVINFKSIEITSNKSKKSNYFKGDGRIVRTLSQGSYMEPHKISDMFLCFVSNDVLEYLCSN